MVIATLVEFEVADKIVDKKSNFLRPDNFVVQGYGMNIITRTSGSKTSYSIYYVYNLLFQYLKKTDPKIIFWTMSWTLDYSFYINPKLKEWDEVYFSGLFKDNSGLPNDLHVDYKKLFNFLKNYTFNTTDGVNSIQYFSKQLPITGGKMKRKRNKSTKKKR